MQDETIDLEDWIRAKMTKRERNAKIKLRDGALDAIRKIRNALPFMHNPTQRDYFERVVIPIYATIVRQVTQEIGPE